MKILCIIEATTVTGPAKNLLNFCRLVRSPEFLRGGPKVEVSIVTFERQAKFGSPNAFVAAARDANIPVDVIAERYRFDPSVIKQLRDIVARRAPDIIQSHMIKSHFLVKMSGLGNQYPWVAYHHGYTSTDLKMQFFNQLNRWSLPSADRVITVCEAFANALARTGVARDRMRIRHNAVVVPRPITKSEQHGLRRQLSIADDEVVLLSVGRLSREKGHADLIRAAAELRESNAGLKFKLLLVGDGPERDQINSIARALDLTDQVVFAGQVANVAPYYSIAGVLALPSHSEGSPNVLLEAMAAGLPIVATSVGGVPEIATNEVNALLVSARDPHSFAAALQRLLTEPELAEQLSCAALARAREFSPESHAQSLVQVYQELVSAPEAIATGSIARQRLFDPLAIARGSDTMTSGTDTI